jgi:chemotaxis protein methyltransferase CheR
MAETAILDPRPEDSLRPLTPVEFQRIRDLVYERCGLDLRAGKEQLVSARLGKKIRAAKFRSFQEYFEHVLGDRTGEAITEMIDALTTNYTHFFREPAHFEFLRTTVLPALRHRDSAAIWSSACATGEEPYSIAMCLADELGPTTPGRFRILATDISTRALTVARRAVFPAERFQDVAIPSLRRYLLRGSGASQGLYRVRTEVLPPVTFQRLNLVEPFSHMGTFPLIFCRNVMIYFDRKTQTDLVERLTGCLEPEGYLFIGHAESLNPIQHTLEYVQPAIYRKSRGTSAAPRGRTGR